MNQKTPADDVIDALVQARVVENLAAQADHTWPLAAVTLVAQTRLLIDAARAAALRLNGLDARVAELERDLAAVRANLRSEHPN